MTVTRVMKARKASICPACSGPVLVGNRIARHPAGWVHVWCAIKEQRLVAGLAATGTEG